ncbi:hypothetical protein IMZ48_48125 [Candidatus Bathyarchaeota archaeon]|nr:hypothetical protein [Candidatus Bathyarchaeota archaeon]
MPLRQVLSGRVTRRLRRNGLSEEMNAITTEKRQRAKQAQHELDALRAQLKEKDLEIYRLQNETIVIDTSRIWDLERQVTDLKQELYDKSAPSPGDTVAFSHEWTRLARDPFEEHSATEHFGDVTMADIQCSTPSRARASFPSPPLTSPMAPETPRYCVETPFADAGVQTSFRDDEMDGLEEEIASLQLEMGKLSSTLEGYASLVQRLNARLAGYEIESEGSPREVMESRVEGLFRALSDRTAALLELTSSLSELGFPGDDAPTIIASLASGFRSARLELEYLSPGESTLPLNSHGAEILDLLLTRLRELSKRAQEDESSIDEYHELELSLRKQLSARVEVMDALKAELEKARGDAVESTRRVEELEVAVSRLRGAVDGYVRDVGELEKLVEKLETEGRRKDKEIKERGGKIVGLEGAVEDGKTKEEQLRAQLADLESKLSEGVTLTEKLRAQVAALEGSRSSLNKQHGTALALRDARVAELRGEIDRLGGSLRGAHSTIQTLRVDNGGLEGRITEERGRARGMIDGMKGELQRVLRMSEEFFDDGSNAGGEASRGGQEGGEKHAVDAGVGTSQDGERSVKRVKFGELLSGGLARRRSSRKRPDSGLGLLDEDELDI